MTTRRPAEVSPPGELLREELEERGWTQEDLADILGRSVSSVNEIIAGKRVITPEMAKGLGAAFDMSPEFWMNREARYQLWRVGEDGSSVIARKAKIYSKGPIKEMLRRGWIESASSIDMLEKNVADFFEMQSVSAEPQFQASAFRKTRPDDADTPAQKAWLFRARKLARVVQVKKFSQSNLDNVLEELRPLFNAPEATRHVPRVLADAGIRFVVVEPLRGTRIDGACFWLDATSPVIAMSVRFDRIDNFWFTLLHELGHVKDNTASLDLDLQESVTDADTKPIEESANQ
ncbi:MAG: HigA family addiction module antitoxin, partial [Chloroflexi bacterium]|nr:HigA family addiction module antitoxin [Chloroflexota bacterium]